MLPGSRSPGTQSKGTELKLSTRTRAITLTAALAGTLALSACGAANEADSGGSGGEETSAQLSGTLNGAGASSQEAAMQGWRAGFESTQSDVTVNYDPVGSGGGREQFIAGGVDFAGSDAALDEEELTAAEERCGAAGIFELPNYISPIAVIYNLEGVDELNLAPATLAGIFAGDDHHLERPGHRRGQPGRRPARTPRSPRCTAGTTRARPPTSPSTCRRSPPTCGPTSRTASGRSTRGEAAQGTSGVVAAVSAGAGAIGYADLSQAGDLGVANIGVGEEFVAPSPEAAAAVVEGSEPVSGRGEYDFAIEVNRETTESGEYPIVLVSYHIGCVEYEDQETADLVKAFMELRHQRGGPAGRLRGRRLRADLVEPARAGAGRGRRDHRCRLMKP